jgi:hypothetical protein
MGFASAIVDRGQFLGFAMKSGCRAVGEHIVSCYPRQIQGFVSASAVMTFPSLAHSGICVKGI